MNSQIKNIVLNLAALMIGCVFVVCVLAAGEVFLRLRHKNLPRAEAVIEHNLSDFTIPDPIMGMKHLPGFSGSHYTKKEGEEVFRAHYEIDDKGHRITPVDNPEEREKAALFFGCSFMFGLGVEQEETLPACFGRESEEFLPVNFAIGGYGPQHLWLQMEQEDFLDQVPGDSGVVVYGYFNDHIHRLLGKRSVVESWGGWLPWLDYSGEELIHRGSMSDRVFPEPPLMKFLQSFHMGQFVMNRLGVRKQDPFTPEAGMDELVAFLLLIEKHVADILPGYKFVVLSFPWTYEEKGFAERMKRSGIPFFDYTKSYPDQDVNQDKYFYRDGARWNWGHPKANVYADVAKWLAEDLKVLDQQQNVEKVQGE